MWTHLLLVLGLSVLIGACSQSKEIEIPAVGDIVVERYDLVGFDQIEIAGFFEIEVAQGEDFRVLVEAERALIPYLDVRVRDNRLFVGLKPDVTFDFEDASQRVTVTLPALTRAYISNHSVLELKDLTVEGSLRLEAADFSTLRGVVEAGQIQIEVSNHSSLTLGGSASSVTGQAMDFSSVELTHLQVTQIDVEVDEKSTLRH
jgi:hypothetical protein